MVDCSIGTPCDPPPRAVVDALASSGTERGYPGLGGQPAAARGGRGLADPPLRPGRGAGVVGGRVRGDQGAGGLRAARAPPARAGQGHGAVPGGLVSDVRHGSGAGRVSRRPRAAGAGTAGRPRPRGHRPRRRRACAGAVVELAVEPDRWPGGSRSGGRLGACARCPGVLRRVLRRVHLGRARRARCSSTVATAWWPCTPSPSDRTWPACASGFYAGDAELVEFLRAVRQHAGLMVPGPAQAAGAVALADDEHVDAQRARYRERLVYLAGVLGGYGCPVMPPEGGFYLWVPVPARPLARRVGHGGGARHRRRDPGQPGRSLRGGWARGTCGWRWSSPWSGWRWWRSVSLG